MQVSLAEVAREQLDAARANPSRRAARSIVGGHDRALRQTVIALVAGAELGEHDNPGEATLYVISGRVEIRTAERVWPAQAGDLLEIPTARHSLAAAEDAAVLLSSVPAGHMARG